MRNRVGSTLFGLCFIIAGIGFAGNALDWWDFSLFFDGWWTMFIIVPCLISIIKEGINVGNGIGLAVGVVFLLSAQDLINGRVIRALVLPGILVIIGLSILFRRNVAARAAAKATSWSEDGLPEYTAIFSGNDALFYKEPFHGATLSAIFGGVKLDIREAIIEGDVVINSTAIFGGTELWVPSGCRVKVSTVPVFGGTSNKAFPGADGDTKPTIFVHSTTIFGGMEIK